MSSAALQSAPHPPTSVGSHSPAAATASNRTYNSSSSSQSRDAYYQQPAATNASPSTRRPSKRPSGNGATANNHSQPYYSPNPSAINASRAPNSDNAFAVGTTTAAAGFAPMAPGDYRSGVPPVVSPRTSSNRTATDRSRRTGPSDEATNSPRHAASGDGSQDRVERQRSNGNTQQNGIEDPAAAAARSRRRAQPEGVPPRPSGSREPRASQSASAVQQRQAMAAGAAPSPTGPSREASEVLNRVIISKPEVDIDRERERMAEAVPSSPVAPSGLSVVSGEGVEDGGRVGSRSRHDHSGSARKSEKHSKFGDYYLGNTLGEGEFGKVKMGWKQEGGVEVAIKLIRRDSVGTNPTRLAKIYREIAILREISHPNIVRLHEMVETEKQIGIILEYASGGELFDYILNHRYLKDPAARRLFAQLVSGVGYLHKKGIVHRDLKLENLLLDRNRNIIITDFGFANTFNPDDELGDEIEYNLTNREYVKRMELDKIIMPSGHRRGDLMQTSCGSPCYAAPELVVSDSLYTGRKVDVWSCGVILYAMLAGYLPFDDDPANPEGDNINLLYKYIVSTTLTFPEYVTPHARDLLRRILVPDPRKRADLFEVARHSWLSEYSHVVGFITSSTTTSNDIGTTTVSAEEQQESSLLARSASVREPAKNTPKSPAVGDLARKHGGVDQEALEHPKPNKDNKRRTVQVEYVAPRSQTQRGEPSTAPAAPPTGSRTRARAGSQGPVEVQSAQPRRTVSTEKPLPQDPPVSNRDPQHANQARRGSTSSRQPSMPPPTRPARENPRSTSEVNPTSAHAPPPVSITRPTTGGSMTSTGSRSGSLALRDRGSYSQPVAPTVAGTNAQGRMAQPKNTKQYSISAPIVDQEQSSFGRPSTNQLPPKFARVAGFSDPAAVQEPKTHKRSNTIGSIFGRTNSIFGGKRNTTPDGPSQHDKPKKSYPPVSMSGTVSGGQHETPRPSIDSRRSISFGFGKKRSGSITGSQTTLQEKSRRFSLLPASFSLKAIGIGKEYGTPGAPPERYDDRPDSRGNYLDTPPPQSARSGATGSHPYANDGAYDRRRDSPRQERRGQNSSPRPSRYTSQQGPSDPRSGVPPQFLPPMNFRVGQDPATESESSLNEAVQNRRGNYQPGFSETEEGYVNVHRPSQAQQNRGGRGVLQKNNRKFTEAYENEQNNGYGPTHSDHAGSSGAARKVMDFFRRRGRDRGQ